MKLIEKERKNMQKNGNFDLLSFFVFFYDKFFSIIFFNFPPYFFFYHLFELFQKFSMNISL